MVRVRGSKVNYARWSSRSLKVLDGRDKLVVESNSTIFKSHLNRDVQICIMQYHIVQNFVFPSTTFNSWLDHLAYLTFDPRMRTTDGLAKPNKFDSTTRSLINTRQNAKEYRANHCLVLSTSVLPKNRGITPMFMA